MSTLLAVGDSFSCGVGVGVAVPPERTWVGLLSAALGMDVDLRAAPGRSSAEVLREQVVPAARSAAVASVLVGLNDVVRSAFDPHATHGDLDAIVARLCARHEVVLVLRLHDAVARLPLPAAMRRRYVGRIAQVNAGIDAAVARQRNAVLVDLAAVPSLRARCAWAVDRIHLSEYGHHAVAAAALRALHARGHPTPDAAVAPAGIPDAAAGRLAELRWFVVHALPWLVSRLPKVLAGRPAGDGAERPVRPDADLGVEVAQASEPGRRGRPARVDQLVNS